MPRITLLMSLLLLLIACDGTTSASSSEWRDNENPDHPSHYSPQESCKKIIGLVTVPSLLEEWVEMKKSGKCEAFSDFYAWVKDHTFGCLIQSCPQKEEAT